MILKWANWTNEEKKKFQNISTMRELVILFIYLYFYCVIIYNVSFNLLGNITLLSDIEKQ